MTDFDNSKHKIFMFWFAWI